MKICARSQCSFQNWYPKFKSCTIKSIFEPIPEDVLSYLKSDGVIIPKEAQTENKPSENDETESYYVGSIDWDSSDEADDEIIPPTFPEFSSKLKSFIEELGGSAFIKLNWSAPTDAAWIATNKSLKCTNLQDIYLLLKSSDKIADNLCQDYKSNDDCEKYYVVLRKWKDIHPGSEFRCFVSDGELIAISQRGKTEYFNHIAQYKFDIINNIKTFYYNKIKDNFLLTKFVFDVVHTSDGRVKVLDFSLYRDQSIDPYLFTWSELDDMEYLAGVSPEFRFIAEETGIQPNMSNHFGVPYDLTRLPEDERQSLIDLLQKQA